MTKKVIRNFGGSNIFLSKGEYGKIFYGVRNFFSEIEGILKQGGNASLPHGGGRWTPLNLSIESWSLFVSAFLIVLGLRHSPVTN